MVHVTDIKLALELKRIANSQAGLGGLCMAFRNSLLFVRLREYLLRRADDNDYRIV